MITSSSYPSSPWLVTWFFSAVTILFLLVNNGGILVLSLFSKLSSRFADLFCKGCKRFQCGSRAASVAAAGAGAAWKPHWLSGTRAHSWALIELDWWTSNLECHRMFTSWNGVLLGCFGFVFEPFENVKPSWALPSWAEAGTQAQFLTLLSRIPSVSLLVLLPFLCAQLNSCLSEFVRGPKNSEVAWALFPSWPSSSLLAWHVPRWAPFSGPCPLHLPPLRSAAPSRPFISALATPPRPRPHLPWDALSSLPSAAPLETPFSALTRSPERPGADVLPPVGGPGVTSDSTEPRPQAPTSHTPEALPHPELLVSRLSRLIFPPGLSRTCSYVTCLQNLHTV